MNALRKDWNEIKTNDSWAIFKIMSEFVEGYERMARIGPCISIFGSARTKEDNPYYQLSVEIGEKLAKAGFDEILDNGLQNWLTADFQQRLRAIVGIRPQTLAETARHQKYRIRKRRLLVQSLQRL